MARRDSVLSSCHQRIDAVVATNPDPFVAARVLRAYGNEHLQAEKLALAERCFMTALSLEADHPPEEVRRRRPAND